MGKTRLTKSMSKTKRYNALLAASGLSLLLAACSASGPTPGASKKGKFDPKYGVSASVRVAQKDGEFRKGGGHYKVGRPYKVSGKTYVPKDQPGYNKTGKASWYGDDFHGRLTANGEIFDMNTLTAAHPTLPLPSYARVTNLKNGRSVIVRINDRGPYAHGRVIDLSKRVAETLAFKNDGITDVRVKYIGKARMDGEDARYLEASYRAKGQRIGDDFRAVPKEGETRRAPAAVMMASAAPAKPKRTNQNYLMAHLPALGGSNTAPTAPMPAALAAPASSGWAPVDLVGDGYFSPLASNVAQTGQLQLAQLSPVQLNYAKRSSMRVANGHDAIERLQPQANQSDLVSALKSKATGKARLNQISSSRANNLLGTFEPHYARRVAEEFASLAAIDMKSDQSGLTRLKIVKLKSGVSWADIQDLRQKLGLVQG